MRSPALLALRALLLAAIGAPFAASGCTSSTDATPAIEQPPCNGNDVLTRDGQKTGYQTCEDGTLVRVGPAACETMLYPFTPCGGQGGACAVDGDCAAGNSCVVGAQGKNCECVDNRPECSVDADCQADEICVCLPKRPTDKMRFAFCAKAHCTSPADCPEGPCAVASSGCPGLAAACRRESDPCVTDADCMGGGCGYSPKAGAFACFDTFPTDCGLGRLLLVGDRALAAPRVDGAGWAADLPEEPGLDPATRAALADHWSRVGALEHASVASFARATLELLSLGAPAELVAETQRAALDEVEHARLAYGLASRYLGRTVGPGPLDVGAARPALDAREALLRLVDEACVGEAFGAAEAIAARDAARDPTVRRALERIADDEARHAALAYRTAAWLLGRVDGATQREALSRLASAIDAVGAPPAAAASVPAHGLLGAAAIESARREARQQVLRPVVASLRSHHECPAA